MTKFSAGVKKLAKISMYTLTVSISVLGVNCIDVIIMLDILSMHRIITIMFLVCHTLDVYAELAFDYHIGTAKEPVELQAPVEEDKELKRPKKYFVQDLEVI